MSLMQWILVEHSSSILTEMMIMLDLCLAISLALASM